MKAWDDGWPSRVTKASLGARLARAGVSASSLPARTASARTRPGASSRHSRTSSSAADSWLSGACRATNSAEHGACVVRGGDAVVHGAAGDDQVDAE